MSESNGGTEQAQSNGVAAPADAAPQQPPIRLGFVGEAGTVRLEIDLFRLGHTVARGATLDAQDLIMAWYTERAKAKIKIIKPGGMAQGMKNFLREKFAH